MEIFHSNRREEKITFDLVIAYKSRRRNWITAQSVTFFFGCRSSHKTHRSDIENTKKKNHLECFAWTMNYLFHIARCFFVGINISAPDSDIFPARTVVLCSRSARRKIARRLIRGNLLITHSAKASPMHCEEIYCSLDAFRDSLLASKSFERGPEMRRK